LPTHPCTTPKTVVDQLLSSAGQDPPGLAHARPRERRRLDLSSPAPSAVAYIPPAPVTSPAPSMPPMHAMGGYPPTHRGNLPSPEPNAATARGRSDKLGRAGRVQGGFERARGGTCGELRAGAGRPGPWRSWPMAWWVEM
jgi:hypothetical protein